MSLEPALDPSALPHDALVELLRSAPNAADGWTHLLRLCEQSFPSDLWGDLEKPPALEDVDAAQRWLDEQLAQYHRADAVGLYLGLVGIDGDEPANLELGVCTTCDPTSDSIEFAWECEWYGTPHAILGLFEMKRVWESYDTDPVFAFADYVLPFGYAGLVLMDALSAAQVRRMITAFGFHDGDIVALCRHRDAAFERIAHF